MIGLYGLRTDEQWIYCNGIGHWQEIRELVATFDNEQQAKDYVNNSTLGAAKNKYFRADPFTGKFRYRKGSLLRYYEDCEIEEVEQDTPPPHNPVMAKGDY